MRKVIECERISIVVMGLDVPHAHIHLIPFNNINDIDFSKPKLKISNEEMQKTADLIKNAI